MKNLFKKPSTEKELLKAGELLATGAAAGMAIATFAGKKANLGGIIGAGISLVIAGVLVALEDDSPKTSYNCD